ncbi:MAG: hypothetical protein DRP67_02240 [Candidatus Omnitrophota bacterium]|nr:MAG: hypothetical protein DRP67_02240 [Candidatus Omnitrophota bacterium]
MHELTVVNNLLKFLQNFLKDKNIEKVIKINLRINPLSCLDEENLNFVFRSLAKENNLLKDAKISVKRGEDPLSREVIIENIEVEVRDGDQKD